jgi:hypothetical protein
MNARESGIGRRASENESATGGASPTPDPRQTTPAEPNWPILYTAVLAELVILIVAFYAFTKAFA